jgi:hypothetical protein
MWNVTGQVFLEPAVITQWAVIDYTEQPDILLRFAKELRDTLRSRGTVLVSFHHGFGADETQV